MIPNKDSSVSLKVRIARAVLILIDLGDTYTFFGQRDHIILCKDSFAFWVSPSVRWLKNSADAYVLNTSRIFWMSVGVNVDTEVGILVPDVRFQRHQVSSPEGQSKWSPAACFSRMYSAVDRWSGVVPRFCKITVE